MSYTIKDGKIQTRTCEINVVHHCNLSCRSCSHLSPALKNYYSNPEQVFSDLSILAKYYRCENVRLVGGEPLLHPNLLDIINAVRSSGISDRIRIATNGLLLGKMTNAFWQALNEVQVSIYPGKEMAVEQLELCKNQAQLHNVELNLVNYELFRDSHAELGTNDKSLVNRIYTTCEFVHEFRCHTVCNGYFYKCPQSLFLPQVLGNKDITPLTVDGIEIVDTITFGEDLLTYLESPEPLASCKYCLANVGKRFPHQQVSRQNWRQLQQKTIEESIDMELLTKLETRNWLQSQLQAWMQKAQQVEADWERSQSWIQELQAGKNWLESEYYAWKQKAEETQAELERSQGVIAAMESSKFWKLRTAWMELKQAIAQLVKVILTREVK